jgi:hypothetical protein
VTGDEFRDQVARIVRARYGHAATERKVGGKDTDILFSMKYPGGDPIKIAIECKNWGRPLRSKDITSIFHEYAPAFATQEIDSLWIVSPLPVRGEQDETVRSFGLKLRFFTFEALANELIDFSPYLNYLITDFDQDGLRQYYSMPRTDHNVDLHSKIIIPWLSEPDASPLAIVAQYGAGKTSYARFLASYLASRALLSPSAPKPILLQLGSLTRQQSLRSLVNSLFSDEFGIEGYKYGLFKVLLEDGHFVVILDGFDEMKHAMKRRDILANFDSIREFMLEKKSKFILLGRPDPFLSPDDEMVFRGAIKVGNQILSNVAGVKFSVVGLDEFTDEEIKGFLLGFLTKSPAGGKTDLKYAQKRVEEIREKGLLDVVRRPVHARMLGVLAASPQWQMSGSTEYDLYYHFVSEFLRRELSQKEARAPVPESERYAFMQRIAWWLWTKRKVISFTADQVPERIVASARKYFDAADTDEVILREMLIGSMLGRRITAEFIVEKEAFSFYFPHRSYWEFLVAEYIGAAEITDMEFKELTEGMNSQIAKFLRERVDRSFASRILEAFKKNSQQADLRFRAQLIDAIRWDSDDKEALGGTPTDFGLASLACTAAISGRMAGGRFLDYLTGLTRLAEGRKGKDIIELTTFYANLFLCSASNLAPGIEERAKSLCIHLNSKFLLDCVESIGLHFMVVSVDKSIPVPVPAMVPNSRYHFFNDCVTYSSKGLRTELTFSSDAIATVLARHSTVSRDEISIVESQFKKTDVKVWTDELLGSTALSGEMLRDFRKVLSFRKPRIFKAVGEKH